jgi:ACS family D-galactonate transporter-like MFS transporter
MIAPVETGSRPLIRRYARARYAVVAGLCAMYFITYVERVNLSVAAPDLARTLHLSKTELGFLFSVFAYPYAAMQILGGWFSDKYGARITLAVLGVIWSLATIWTGLSGGFVTLVLSRVLLGVGEGGAFPTATRALTWWLPKGERGFAQGITHGFARLGGAVTPPIVAWLVLTWNWRFAFVVLGVLSLVWVAAWYAWFRDSPLQKRGISAVEIEEIGPAVIGRSSEARVPTPWAEMLRRMWLVSFVDFCYGWSLWVFLTWMPSFFSDTYHVDLKKMASFATLTLLSGVVGDTLGGVLSDALYRRTGNLRLARLSLLIAGLGGAVCFMMPAPYASDATHAVWLLAGAFFMIELTNAVLWSLPIDIAGRHGGTAAGMMNTGFGVAGMIAPVVFGALLERTHDYKLPFFSSAVLLAVGAIAACFVDPTKRVLGFSE